MNICKNGGYLKYPDTCLYDYCSTSFKMEISYTDIVKATSNVDLNTQKVSIIVL